LIAAVGVALHAAVELEEEEGAAYGRGGEAGRVAYGVEVPASALAHQRENLSGGRGELVVA